MDKNDRKKRRKTEGRTAKRSQLEKMSDQEETEPVKVSISPVVCLQDHF